MNAVIEIKGKQYHVEPEQVIRTLQVEGEPGDKIEADRVLVLLDDSTAKFGQPALDSAKVEMEIVRHAKGPKIDVFWYQNKKRVSRRKGYREKISYLRIKGIKE